MVHFILWFILCAICFLMYYKIRYPFVRKLNQLPGPVGGPIFGALLMALMTPRHKLYPVLHKITNQYGPIWHTWLGPKPFVVVSDAEGAQTVLSSSTNITKPFLYSFFEPWVGSGLVTSNGSLWHYRRRILTPAFHYSILEKFFHIIVKNSSRLVRILESEIDSTKVNLLPFISECSLQNICETAMGVKLSENDEMKSRYAQNVQIFLKEVVSRILNPFMYPNVLYKLSPRYKKQMAAAKELHGVAMNG